MRAPRILLPAVLLVTACAGERAVPDTSTPPDDTERIVRRAEAWAQAGAHTEAVLLFEEATRNPGSPFVDRALIGLTRSLCNPDYDGRDLRKAYLLADRLVRDYPKSPHAGEARAWRDLLLAYLVRGRELDRRTMELEQTSLALKRQALELERLKGVERELERRTRELQRHEQQLERLKRLDLDLEQRKRKP